MHKSIVDNFSVSHRSESECEICRSDVALTSDWQLAKNWHRQDAGKKQNHIKSTTMYPDAASEYYQTIRPRCSHCRET